jgi:hypothetical protein
LVEALNFLVEAFDLLEAPELTFDLLVPPKLIAMFGHLFIDIWLSRLIDMIFHLGGLLVEHGDSIRFHRSLLLALSNQERKGFRMLTFLGSTGTSASISLSLLAWYSLSLLSSSMRMVCCTAARCRTAHTFSSLLQQPGGRSIISSVDPKDLLVEANLPIRP